MMAMGIMVHVRFSILVNKQTTIVSFVCARLLHKYDMILLLLIKKRVLVSVFQIL
jgi:hypothetical protein